MRWHDLLFAHWPVRAEELRPLIPPALEVDTFDGWAWLGIVPFLMSNVRLRRVPNCLSLAFAELNVRTYVHSGAKRGIWFFSLDACNRLAVRIARAWYGVPYLDARMSVRRDGDWIRYESTRTNRGAPVAEWRCDYRGVGPEFQAQPDTLEHFLVERYCLFATNRRRGVGYGDMRHAPWPLQKAEAEIHTNTMCDGLGLKLPEQPPLVHFASSLDTRAWSVRPVEG